MERTTKLKKQVCAQHYIHWAVESAEQPTIEIMYCIWLWKIMFDNNNKSSFCKTQGNYNVAWMWEWLWFV